MLSRIIQQHGLFAKDRWQPRLENTQSGMHEAGGLVSGLHTTLDDYILYDNMATQRSKNTSSYPAFDPWPHR